MECKRCELATDLAAQGVLVAGIDLHHYAAELSKPRDKCSYIAGEFEDYSHELQKRFSPDRYHLPILIGVRKGASLVYAVAAQGSSGTFLGILTLGFAPRWSAPLKLCQSYELHYDVGTDRITTLKPSEQLSTPWIAVHSSSDKAFGVSDLKKFIAAVGTAKIEILSNNDSAFSQPMLWRDAIISSTQLLTQSDAVPKVVADELRDLPIEEVPATSKQSNRMALFLTGDGGWASLDKEVSKRLAQQGIPVVALNSLQYFWKAKTPEQAAADVTRILRHYLSIWKKDEVLIVGYSFGADAAPFIFNRLPIDMQHKTRSLSLFGLAAAADFEVHVSGWVGLDHRGTPTVPEIEKIALPILCVYGEGEKDTACPLLKGRNQHSVKVGEGHHFGDQYSTLVERVLQMTDARN